MEKGKEAIQQGQVEDTGSAGTFGTEKNVLVARGGPNKGSFVAKPKTVCFTNNDNATVATAHETFQKVQCLKVRNNGVDENSGVT